MKSIFKQILWLSAWCGFAACAVASDVPGTEGDGDFTLGPQYTNAPEMKTRQGIPHGTVHQFIMESADSKIYPGIRPITNDAYRAHDAWGNRLPLPAEGGTTNALYRRRVAVYVPAQYVSGSPAPFIVVQDGPSYLSRVTNALDNLIAEHRVPVMIGVFVNHGGGDAQGSERGLEYDTVSGAYTEFIETEVLPKIEKDYQITFTRDPEGRATMGGSSGAAAAFTMGWFHPELYHRILSYSGTFVNQQSPLNPDSPHGAWDYHDHLIAQSDRKPLRIWMEVGERDNQFKDPDSTYHNWVTANNRMAAALKAKGYHYHYVLCLNARHVDGGAVGATLPDALVWLWRGYQVNK